MELANIRWGDQREGRKKVPGKRKKVSGRKKIMYKGPEEGKCMVHSRSCKQARVAGTLKRSSRQVRDGAGEASRSQADRPYNCNHRGG